MTRTPLSTLRAERRPKDPRPRAVHDRCSVGMPWRFVLLSSLLVATPHAFPAGAGSCPRGRAAVGGLHVSGPDVIRQGSLLDGGFQVTIGDVVLSAWSNRTSSSSNNNASSSNSSNSNSSSNSNNSTPRIPEFLVDTSYEISVVGTRYTYKGCLMRLESLQAAGQQDLYAALLPGTNMGPAFACFGSSNLSTATSTETNAVTGLSHTDNMLKTVHKGVLRMSDPGDMVLDITVVGLNNATASLYAYSEFRVRFVNADESTDATSSPTSTAPSASTTAPVNDTTAPPTPTPVESAPTVLPPGTFEAPSTRQTLWVDTLQLVLPIQTSTLLNSTRNTTTVVWNKEDQASWINVTQEWFDDFYNQGLGEAEWTVDTINSTRRHLQTLRDNYGVVPGSMTSTLFNVTSILSSVRTSNDTVTLTYHHYLDYRKFNASRLTPPFGPLQYATLPFRSRQARWVYAQRLQSALPERFGTLTDNDAAWTVPLLLGPPPTSETDTATHTSDDSGLSGGAIAGIVIACLVVALGAAALLLVSSQRDDGRPHDPVASLVPPDFDRGTFSFGPSGGGAAVTGTLDAMTDLEASSDEVKEKDTTLRANEYVVYAPSGRLGIVLDSPDQGGPVVYVIKENSPLMEAIAVGDRLIAVDEVDVRHMTPTRVSKLISKRSANPMRKLTLLKTGKEEVTIVFEKEKSNETIPKG